MNNQKEMSDLKANLIAAGGIGTMLWIAGLPLVLTIGIGAFTIGGLAGIAIVKRGGKNE